MLETDCSTLPRKPLAEVVESFFSIRELAAQLGMSTGQARRLFGENAIRVGAGKNARMYVPESEILRVLTSLGYHKPWEPGNK
jgi:hypothetical protein